MWTQWVEKDTIRKAHVLDSLKRGKSPPMRVSTGSNENSPPPFPLAQPRKTIGGQFPLLSYSLNRHCACPLAQLVSCHCSSIVCTSLPRYQWGPDNNLLKPTVSITPDMHFTVAVEVTVGNLYADCTGFKLQLRGLRVAMKTIASRS